MAELLADDTLASLISECLAAVEVLHELLAEDSFGELGRERVKPGKKLGPLVYAQLFCNLHQTHRTQLNEYSG